LGKPLQQVEEVALSLKGRKRKLTREIWIDYFAQDRLQLNAAVIAAELTRLSGSFSRWYDLIGKSFLSPAGKDILIELVKKRRALLQI
jgi:serine/threonine-protein kinase HipA